MQQPVEAAGGVGAAQVAEGRAHAPVGPGAPVVTGEQPSPGRGGAVVQEPTVGQAAGGQGDAQAHRVVRASGGEALERVRVRHRPDRATRPLSRARSM